MEYIDFFKKKLSGGRKNIKYDSDEEFERKIKKKIEEEKNDEINNSDDEKEEAEKKKLWNIYNRLHLQLDIKVPYSKSKFLDKDLDVIKFDIQELREDLKDMDRRKEEEKKITAKKEESKSKSLIEPEKKKKEESKSKSLIEPEKKKKGKEEKREIRNKGYAERRYKAYLNKYRLINKIPPISKDDFLKKDAKQQTDLITDARREMKDTKEINVLRKITEKGYEKLNEEQKKEVRSSFITQEYNLLNNYNKKIPKWAIKQIKKNAPKVVKITKKKMKEWKQEKEKPLYNRIKSFDELTRKELLSIVRDYNEDLAIRNYSKKTKQEIINELNKRLEFRDDGVYFKLQKKKFSSFIEKKKRI